MLETSVLKYDGLDWDGYIYYPYTCLENNGAERCHHMIRLRDIAMALTTVQPSAKSTSPFTAVASRSTVYIVGSGLLKWAITNMLPPITSSLFTQWYKSISYSLNLHALTSWVKSIGKIIFLRMESNREHL